MATVRASARPQLESLNPTTGELVGVVPRADAESVQLAVDDAGAVHPFWAQLSLADRARYMRRAAQVVIDRTRELGELIAREGGRPIAEAQSLELLPTVDALHWIADCGPSLLRDERIGTRQLWLLGKRHRHVREPLGVVGVISSSRSAWLGPFLQTAIALMAGNGVVLKPAPRAALVGGRVERAFVRAGVPEGLIGVVHGGDEAGAALAEASGVARIFFTGSPRAGRRIEAACSRRGRRTVLELGGKDPQLVLADARIDRAVAGALWGAFANAGQSRSSIERVYVAREVADPFLNGLVRGARALRIGDPVAPDTEVGPLLSAERLERVCEVVDEAVAGGATLRCGGPVEIEGLRHAPFFAPAVLTGVEPGMRVAGEPVSGPVVCVTTVDSEEEAIALANDSRYGLGASVWTRDRARGERIARRLEAGMVWVNDHRYSHGAVQCAWGGTKGSGAGRFHGEPGFRECTETKLVGSDAAPFDRPWWPPRVKSLPAAAEATARIVYGRDRDRVPALRAGARPLARAGGRILRELIRR
ncbi:MAG TPA: aldehyde dehydrogenase family protein [Thermoleophilaceae bacterium]|nr:aldehyde dehydrogenase family protein [Thermoleophilaceae bacterium]